MATIHFDDGEVCSRYSIKKTIEIWQGYLKEAENCAHFATAAKLDQDGEEAFVCDFYNTLIHPQISQDDFCQLVYDIMDEDK